MLNSKFRI